MTGSLEKFRVFRLDEDDDAPAYVGTFAAETPKEAVREAIWIDDEVGPQQRREFVYEAHVLRNASVFETRSRDERFIDSVKQLNTQRHFVENSVVARRLAFIPDDEVRADAAERFLRGETIKALAKELGLTTTRAGYCLRQELVEQGKVPPNATGRAWAACIQRVTTSKIEV